MKKTMTAKEFKAVLDKAGITFDIYGFEGILNIVSIGLNAEADTMKARGFDAGAKGYKEMSDKVFDELDKRGYYKR